MAGSLAQLSLGTSRGRELELTNSNEPARLLETVSWLIHVRRDRSAYLPASLFGEPAWDILLHLFRSELVDEPVSVAAARLAAAVPETTASRWLRVLEQQRLILVQSGAGDGVETLVALAPKTRTELRRYFVALLEAHGGQ
jgi:hypothetical protein